MLIPRRLSVSLLIVSLLSTVTAAKAQLELPKPTGWVNDFDKVIDAKTQKRLTDLSAKLDKKAHAQIAVVTIDSLGGAFIDDYAHSLFNQWGIGNKGENRGVLILFAMSERKFRIEVGLGLETLLPNERVAEIVKEVIPDLKQQRYSKAAFHTASMVAAIIAKDRG